MLYRNLANIITFTRIIGSIIIIFIPVLSKPFYIVYACTGFSDFLDGFIARKTNTVSNFGKKLDSFSDLLFYIIMMLKIMSYLIELLPLYVWIMIISILLIRLYIYIYYGIKKHSFYSSHSVFNKITGLMMFLLPFILKTNYFVIYSILVCIVAYISVFYEIRLIIININND